MVLVASSTLQRKVEKHHGVMKVEVGKIAMDEVLVSHGGGSTSVAHVPPVTRFTNCLFQEEWWLEAVAPGAWQAAVVGSGRDIQARLAFVLNKGRLFSSIRQPFLTQSLGPWYRPTGGKISS